MTPKAAVYSALAITLYYSSNLNISFDYKTPVPCECRHSAFYCLISFKWLHRWCIPDYITHNICFLFGNSGTSWTKNATFSALFTANCNV